MDLAREESRTAKAGPQEPMKPTNMEARKKGEAIAAAKHEKPRRKWQMRKRQDESAGMEGAAGELADLETPVTLQEKSGGGSRPVVEVGNQDAEKLVDQIIEHQPVRSRQ